MNELTFTNFYDLTENDLILVDAGGLGLAILGGIGGAVGGALAGAAITVGCPPAGAIIGGIGGACTGAVAGWKK